VPYFNLECCVTQRPTGKDCDAEIEIKCKDYTDDRVEGHMDHHTTRSMTSRTKGMGLSGISVTIKLIKSQVSVGNAAAGQMMG
jgi:hypothetical protein